MIAGDDIPLVLWKSATYRQASGYIRVTTFASADRTKIHQVVEYGPTGAGPWQELRRYL